MRDKKFDLSFGNDSTCFRAKVSISRDLLKTYQDISDAIPGFPEAWGAFCISSLSFPEYKFVDDYTFDQGWRPGFVKIFERRYAYITFINKYDGQDVEAEITL